ncbi:MAG: hypothetical protein Kow0022_09250 [Phycisphaerales bacterium]
MTYRVCKAFEVESGHMLSKHPDRCRYPHGHSRRIEIVVAAETLDDHDMVCDFKALKLAVGEFLDRFDHSMAVNSDDPLVDALRSVEGGRVIVFKGVDPTTEVLARHIHDFLKAELASGKTYRDERGTEYALREGLSVERVRVWETSSSWAEYAG